MPTSTRLQHEILIRRSPDAVYDYVSTPARWPEWHPSSLSLEGGAEHPLPAGARFDEEIRAGGRRGHLSWTVRSAERPQLWVADAVAHNGVRLRLTYRLQPLGASTRFERQIEYQMPNLWWALLDRVLLRRRIDAESAESLRRLKGVMEATAAG